MPKINWNVNEWDKAYDWHMKGEEWSAAWGSSEAQWHASIYPRLHAFLPAGRILEIAPGFGRWTRYLLGYCEHFTGIDLASECVKACGERFSGYPDARFVKNDGLSLAAADGLYDLIFSFDSLVHADTEVMECYIPEIISLLAQDGVAFIHHSNFADSDASVNQHNRSENVTAKYIKALVERSGGSMRAQELINWGGSSLIDSFSLFKRGAAAGEPALIRNPHFMEEAEIVKNVFDKYCFAR